MRLVVLLVFLSGYVPCQSQVLISILLGDKLNSGKVEFGLDGGLSLSSLQGLSGTKTKNSLNLGFYFDIRMKNPQWMFHTGVMVKSTMGATDIPVYPLGDVDLDNAFAEGSIRRKLGYFYVPAMIKYKFKNNFFGELGPMFGLMNKSTDEFVTEVKDKDDLTYKLNVRDNYHPLDMGIIGGVGYRLMGGNGMNFGIRYYIGFVDITLDDVTPNQYNRSLYLYVGIPIGAGKKTDPSSK